MEITTTAQDLLDGEEPGSKWIVQNLGTETVLLVRTDSSVESAPADLVFTETGLRVAEGQAITFDEPLRDYNGGTRLWAKTASGTTDIIVAPLP